MTQKQEQGPAIPSLKGLDYHIYYKLLTSGMFWEWYPNATGRYLHDTEEDNADKNKYSS